jgi:hypothetical protein
MEIKFTNVGKKQSQKELITEIMDLDAKDGLYEISDEEIEKAANEHFEGDLMWSERIAFKLAIRWYREQLKKIDKKL